MILHELYESFLQERRFLKNCTAKTIRCYRQAWNGFAPYVSDVVGEDQIRPALKSGVVKKMSDGKLKPTSINVYVRALNSFLGWGYKEDHFKCRIKPIELLKTHQRVVPTLTEAQVLRLVQYKPLRHQRRVHAMMCVILDTGLRVGECLRIQRRDVDLENFLLTVRHGKGNKERKVPMSAIGRKILFRFMSQSNAPAYIFGTRTGTQVLQRNAERDLKGLTQKLGFGKVYWHLLRHSFGTLFIHNGGNVADLQRIMGHAAITTTMLYVHNQTEQFVVAHNSLSPLARAASR